MLSPAVIAAVFGLVFVAELPDKTAIASLVLGMKYPTRWVFSGAAAAFAVHVVLAVTAGSLIALLPRRPVEAIVGVFFLAGAVVLWRRGGAEDDEEAKIGNLEDPRAAKVAGLAFGVVFVAEFGDLTQILTADLAAKYTNPLSVGIGAVLGLWAVALLAIFGGKTLLQFLPIAAIVRVAALIMVGLASYSIYAAIRG